jgi:manganese/zinc/iron transport system permease protein
MVYPGLASAADGSSDWGRVIFLQDYNTRVVMVGTSLLGVASGVIGTFLMLRKRALLGDAVAHATLPGVVLAWLILTLAGSSALPLLWLLIGAGITGALGMLTMLLIRQTKRLKDDAALGIVLSVYFGLGVVLLGIASRMGQGSSAGLKSFINGRAASILLSDMWLIAGAALVITMACALFYKEFKLLCFDAEFANSQGWPVHRLDVLLMALVVATTVIGLQTVGLILIVALLVIPPAAARCWSDRLGHTTILAGVIGGLSCLAGAVLSAVHDDLPTGPVIVLWCAALFALSTLIATKRGLLWRIWRHHQLEEEIRHQHLLRALFELAENADASQPPHAVSVDRLAVAQRRSWNSMALARAIRRAARADLLVESDGHLRLTERGSRAAARLVRNHRLWELFLIRYAETAPSRVDRGADLIEHVLDEEIVAELQAELDATGLPSSPHGAANP